MTLPSPSIRYAQESDLPTIVEIYNSTVTSRVVTADTSPVSVSDRLPWFHSHHRDRHPIWVSTTINETQEQVTGWLSLSEFYGRPAYAATAELSVYISPHHRRQGIGRALVHHGIVHCPGLSISTLLGFVFAQNQPSMALLQNVGFKQWGFLPQVAQFESHTCDLVILGLDGLNQGN